jgi:D-sedoheptulose 7-phosphate isomerase
MSRLPVAILAGGLATRLGPLARETPKSLVEVAGKPFIHHQLEQLRSQGIGKVVLCVGHLGERVVAAVGDGSRFGLEVAYSFDGPELGGTAGALRRALEQLGPAFFVLYGDSYLQVQYAAIEEAYQRAQKLALMTVFRNDGQWDTSNVEFQGGRILAYSKAAHDPAMRHIDYGLGVLDRSAIEDVPATGSSDLAAVYERLLKRGELAGFEVRGRFYEIGSVTGLEETRRYLAGGVHGGQTEAAGRGPMSHTEVFLSEAKRVIDGLDAAAIERMAEQLEAVRQRGGRLFILGVGGSAANASHAVNDFRKIAGIEAYAPTDNVSELTARTNDEGWPTIFVEWLRVSRLKPDDLVLVLSVGGGSREKNISPNLVSALEYAGEVGAPVIGIVGKDGGYTARVATACAIVPTVNPEHITPHSEAFQAVVWHLLVSHPRLKSRPTKWESVR